MPGPSCFVLVPALLGEEPKRREHVPPQELSTPSPCDPDLGPRVFNGPSQLLELEWQTRDHLFFEWYQTVRVRQNMLQTEMRKNRVCGRLRFSDWNLDG